MNTAALEPDAALKLFEQGSRHLGLPVADPMRGGEAFRRLVDAVLGETRGP
jgi:uncharacterized NAD-dependent epimerase/dehydratase family protein